MSQDIVIWARIVLWLAFFFGPTFLAVWLVHSSRDKSPSFDGVCAISPHPAILLPTLPFVVGVFGLIWALVVTETAIHFAHVFGFLLMLSIIYAVEREYGSRWQIDWSEETVTAPMDTGLFGSLERITVRWDDITGIYEESGRIYLTTCDGRSIWFARKYRGYLSFMRTIYRLRPDLEASRAPKEWTSELGS